MKILITGGSGFIGTNLAQYYLDLGFEISNVDIRSPKNVNHVPFWQDVDILNFDHFRNALEGFIPDYVIHLAARTDLDETKDIDGYKVNIQGVRNLMEICKEFKSINRVVIASSMLVCKLGYIPSNIDDYLPSTLYGESKVLTEKITKEYEEINWVLVRPTSIWGPWFGAPYNGFFKLVRSGRYLNLSRKNAAIKTYGYVQNTCRQIHALMLSNNTDVRHNYFYLGDNPPINISDWANFICELELKRKPLIAPIILLKCAAKIGDIFKKLGINFPMTSFRFSNMTTDHILNLDRTNHILEEQNILGLELDLKKNTRDTLKWLNTNN